MKCKTCGHPETAHFKKVDECVHVFIGGQECSCPKFVVPCCGPEGGDDCPCSCHNMPSTEGRPPLPPSTDGVTYVWADELEALENEVDHLNGFVNAFRKRRGLPPLTEPSVD